MARTACITWSHPAYKSVVLRHVLRNETANNVEHIVPATVLPTHCQRVEDVIDKVSSSSFWDDILYCNMAKAKFHALNKSKVGSPRERNYSTCLSTEQRHDGRWVHKLYWYPRRYVPCTDFRMSPTPKELRELCTEVFQLLFDFLPKASREYGPFNSVQVRGYYEAFKPHTGAHTDNGLMDSNANIKSEISAQLPNSAVAIYMIGDCPMRLDFLPLRDKRPPVSIPLRDGMLMMLHPDDDCRCKHSIHLDVPLKELKCDRYRIAFVMRQLQVVREYDASTRMLILTEE